MMTVSLWERNPINDPFAQQIGDACPIDFKLDDEGVLGNTQKISWSLTPERNIDDLWACVRTASARTWAAIKVTLDIPVLDLIPSSKLDFYPRSITVSLVRQEGVTLDWTVLWEDAL